jgi:hypothetical protein
MKIEKQEISKDEILQHWRQGKSSLDWRRLTSNKEKKNWLQACLHWTGLPKRPIRAFNYIIDGAQIKSDTDYYCLLGEVFFGYRGYFGSNLDGWYDCFSEIHIHENTKPLVERGAKVIVKNSDQLKQVLMEVRDDYFLNTVEGFKTQGFEVKLD